METVLIFLLCSIIAAATILISAYILTKYILYPYRIKTQTATPEQMFKFLQLIIENDIAIFDKEVLGTRDKGLTNSEYENYYTLLVTAILDGLSPDFVDRMSYLISEKHLAEIVSSIVHEYLAEKII